MLLASVFRSRSLALGVSLALLGFHVWGVANVPHYLLQAVSTFPDNTSLASDIAAQDTFPGLLQRLALVSVATGCIVAAARFYPRDDGVSRRLQASTAWDSEPQSGTGRARDAESGRDPAVRRRAGGHAPESLAPGPAGRSGAQRPGHRICRAEGWRDGLGLRSGGGAYVVADAVWWEPRPEAYPSTNETEDETT